MKKILCMIIFLVGMGTSGFAMTEKEWFDKGVEHLKQEQYDEAVESFSELISLAPQNPDAYKNRGVAHMKQDQYDLAIADFQKTLELVPDLKGIYSNLGVAWYYKGDFVKSIENYDQEIKRTPDSHFALFNRAICLAEIESFEKSLADVDRSIELEPRFYLAHCLKGDLLLKLKKPEQAQSAYEVAMALDPDQEYAREQMEQVRLELEKQAYAARAAENTNKNIVEMPIGPRPSKKKELLEEPPIDVEMVAEKIKDTTPNIAPPETEAAKEPATGIAKAAVADVPEITDMTEVIEVPEPPKVEPAPVPVGKYALQLGAFRVPENADRMKAKMEKRGYQARILNLTRKDGVSWYLLRMGDYADKARARQAAKELKEKYSQDSMVRPRGKF